MSLPKGWAHATVAELAAAEPRSIVDGPFGSALKSSDYTLEGARVIRLSNLGSGVFESDDVAFVSHEKYELLRAHDARPGDLVVAALGDPVGRACIVPDGIGTAIVKADCFRVRVASELDKHFLLSTLNSPQVRAHFSEQARGVGRLRINLEILRSACLPLPPLSEQRRIVAKLDALTARICRARAELDRVPVLGARFREEALDRCFEASGAAIVELGSQLQAIEAGKNLRCEERPPREGENGVVKVSAVTWGRFDEAQSKTLPADFSPPEKSRIKVGDLLISRANTLELVGAAVLVDHQPRDLFLSDKILRLVVPDEDRKWILWFLRSPHGRRQIEGMATGNQLSMRNISQDALKRIRLPFPDPQIRAERIRTLETAFARADRLEAEAARARKLLDRLERAILAKAFRGELVPQDPNDEPASVLLERIRGERLTAPKAKRARRSASS